MNGSKVIEALGVILRADGEFLARMAVLYPLEVLAVRDYNDLDARVLDLWENEGKIPAIKLYRAEVGCDLKTAKAACEELARVTPPRA